MISTIRETYVQASPEHQAALLVQMRHCLGFNVESPDFTLVEADPSLPKVKGSSSSISGILGVCRDDDLLISAKGTWTVQEQTGTSRSKSPPYMRNSEQMHYLTGFLQGGGLLFRRASST